MLVDLVVVLDVVRAAGRAVVRVGGPGTAVAVVAHTVITVAIAEVDHLVRIVFRLVMEHRAARTGGVLIRIPVEGRGEAPVAVEAVEIRQCIGRYVGGGFLAGAVIDTWQLYLAVFEVEGLTDTEGLTLEAVGLDPAAGHAQRQLVLVADTILAAETVFTPQRGVAEGRLASVEDRNIGLVFFRYV